MSAEAKQSEKAFHEKMQKEAEKTHLEFLQEMYHYYNLEEPPKSIPITLSEKYRRGRGRFFIKRISDEIKNSILIGNNGHRKISDDEEIKIVVAISAHETAHYLHFKVNNPIYLGRNRLNEIATEIVAEFGTHLFYGRIGSDIPKKAFANTLSRILYPFIDRNRVSQRSVVHKELNNNVENLLEGIILDEIASQKDLPGILKELEKRKWGKELTKDLIKYGFFI